MQNIRNLAFFTLLMLPFFGFTQSFRSVRSVELPRGEGGVLSQYSEDSRFAAPLESWRGVEGCDTLFQSSYVSPIEWLNREVILRVGVVDAPYSVEVNGEVVAECRNGNLPMEFNISRENIEGRNEVALRLSPNSPMRVIESWRESNKLSKEPIQGARVLASARMTVRDIFTDVTGAEGVMSGRVGIVMKSYALNERLSILRYELRDAAGRRVRNGLDSLQLKHRGEDTLYFSTILSPDMVWSAESPMLYQLEMKLENEGREVEHHIFEFGMRMLEVSQSGDVKVNGVDEKLRLRKVAPTISEEEIVDLQDRGVNTLLFEAGEYPEKQLRICDERGMYVILTAPIDSSKSGAEITVGGNVTNSPEWKEEYLSRLERLYYLSRRHSSVVALNIAKESLNGYNLYEGYLHLKSLEREIPIIYLDGAGEWNSDKIAFERH